MDVAANPPEPKKFVQTDVTDANGATLPKFEKLNANMEFVPAF